jgi:hypothetical protein
MKIFGAKTALYLFKRPFKTYLPQYQLVFIKISVLLAYQIMKLIEVGINNSS